VSAGSKLATTTARSAFAEAVTVFGAVPARWSRVAAGLVVLIELVVAVGLCVSQLSRPALYGAAVLLLAFALALAVGLRRGVMTPCACRPRTVRRGQRGITTVPGLRMPGLPGPGAGGRRSG
jgi:hypothetical protein